MWIYSDGDANICGEHMTIDGKQKITNSKRYFVTLCNSKIKLEFLDLTRNPLPPPRLPPKTETVRVFSSLCLYCSAQMYGTLNANKIETIRW